MQGIGPLKIRSYFESILVGLFPCGEVLRDDVKTFDGRARVSRIVDRGFHNVCCIFKRDFRGRRSGSLFGEANCPVHQDEFLLYPLGPPVAGR